MKSPTQRLCPSVTPPDAREADALEVWLERAARLGQPILLLAARDADNAALEYASSPTPARAADLQGEATVRLAGACAERQCAFFADNRCELAASVARHLPPSDSAKLPRCQIRARCRWFAQEGAAACARCPEVTTRVRTTSLAQRIAEEALLKARQIRRQG